MHIVPYHEAGQIDYDPAPASGLLGVGVVRTPGCGPRDPLSCGLKTGGNLAECRHWCFCIMKFPFFSMLAQLTNFQSVLHYASRFVLRF